LVQLSPIVGIPTAQSAHFLLVLLLLASNVMGDVFTMPTFIRHVGVSFASPFSALLAAVEDVAEDVVNEVSVVDDDDDGGGALRRGGGVYVDGRKHNRFFVVLVLAADIDGASDGAAFSSSSSL